MVTKSEIAALAAYKKYPCRNQGGEKLRFCVEDQGTVFVFAKGKRRYGRRYDPEDFLALYDVKPEALQDKDPTPAWRRRLKRAVKCMDDSGLWPEIRDIFKNMLDSGMTVQDKDALYKLTRKDLAGPSDTAKELMEKYPFAFLEVDHELRVNTRYIYELSDCRLKAMYFGRLNQQERDLRWRHLAGREDYYSGRIKAGYDVSFRYQAKDNKAVYSEEYRNCGNGHYYIALDADTALFVEDD